MKNKECKITCDNKNVASVTCSKDGCNFKLTPEGKKLMNECCKDGCC